MTRLVDVPCGPGRAASEDRGDAQLVAEMHRPDSDALRALIDRYLRLVHRVAADILRDEGEAEDVAQEVFLEIYRKSHLYDPARGAVRVWLLQYAYHRSLRRRNALRRRAAYAGEPLDAAETRADGNRAHLTRDECRWVIRAAMQQLPERQRRTLELACLEQVSLREVAERLRVSLGCARHYYYRGLARLRAWAKAGVAPPVTHAARRRPEFGPERRRATRSRGRAKERSTDA
jgi:RNA polymerase sigma-70 factor, ECF subfamily